MGKNNFRKLKLLLWKNVILQLRRPIGTTVEFVLPILLLASLLIPRYVIPDGDYGSPQGCSETYDRSQDIKKIRIYMNWGPRDRLAYYPINSFTTSILNSAVQSFSIYQPRWGSLKLKLVSKTIGGKQFVTLDDVIEEAVNFTYSYAGVITFDNSSANEHNIKYSIRLHDEKGNSWQTDQVYPWDLSPGRSFGGRNYLSLFIKLQYFIDAAIIQEKAGDKTLSPARYMHQFPTGEYIVDKIYILIFRMAAPIVFMFGFYYTASMIIKELVVEKQLGLKESMKMMGLPSWTHWTAWFVKSLLFFLLIIIIQTIMLKAGKIFEYVGGVVLFITLLMYAMATICSLFLLSVFFFNGTRAMLVTEILWFVTYAPSVITYIPGVFDRLPVKAKYALCLLPNTCLGFMINILTKFESAQKYFTLLDIHVPVNVQQDFVLSDVYFMLFVDCLVYLLLTWYIENIYPGEFGIPKPFYFPFQPSYWCNTAGGIYPHSDGNELKNFEAEPTDLEVSVSIKHLRKEFYSATGSKIAVDDVNLNIYKGQITALLGGNDAGKTTALSMLTGLFPPTSGMATVDGKSILTDMDAVRDSFGICPQHNVLFERLTVKEHLEFFSALKGVSREDGAEEITQLINDMQLAEKTNEKVLSLSGGMKRKLCCAIALVGGSETVLLDEPTSGMDPYARRATWDVLQKYRKDKTIILTTHFMDEADYLGDRIAIMVSGRVYCCGSSLFLKKQYGIGYHLTLVKSPSFNADMTSSLLKEHVPTAVQKSDVAAEVSYILHEDSRHQFKALFETLEKTSNACGVVNFGISVTTMEEVFLKVGEIAEEEDRMADQGYDNNDTGSLINVTSTGKSRLSSITSVIEDYDLAGGMALKVFRFYAMFVKRLLNSKRKKTAVLTQLLIPFVMLSLGLTLVHIFPTLMEDPNKPEPPRELVLSMLKTKGQVIASHFSSSKTSIKNSAKLYYQSIGVKPNDITEKLQKITDGNQGKKVSILFSKTKPYHGKINGSNRNACCNYKNIILNPSCDTTQCDLKKYCNSRNPCFPVSTKGKCSGRDPNPSSQNHPELRFPDISMDEYIFENSEKEKAGLYHRDVAGFTVDKAGDYTAWYSGQGYHTLPSSFSAVSNIILKSTSGDEKASIVTTNHPLPRKKVRHDDDMDDSAEMQMMYGIIIVCFLTIASCLLAASFIPFLVTEKVTQAKHIQFVSGVNSISYWGGTFCWDFINLMVPGFGFLILFAAFDLDTLKGELGSVFLLIVLFGLSVLPFVYLFSFIFKGPVTAYAFISSLVMILSLVGLLVTSVLQQIKETESDGKTTHYVFHLFPTYAFPKAMLDLWTNKLKNATGTFSIEQPGIGGHCIFMFLMSLVYFFFIIIIEENVFSWIFPSKIIAVASIMDEGLEDQDVVRERRKVQEMSPSSDTALLLKDLTKVYRSNGMMAVDHLNLEISRGECFGLLGINGAGKTTAFGMLTGELAITEGSAYLHGMDIEKQLKDVQQIMGYCPQFDGLVGTLTGREMLRMFARLRGVPNDKIEKVVRKSITNLKLDQWADKMCGTYSGGNKRKLSTALALVGNPAVIFLDEPTSGMDPGARRQLWNTLTDVLATGRSIVLTSHSMEECEALCTKLVIMVNGKFKCVGSLQHLKSRFGKGYVVMLKVESTVAEESTQPEDPCLMERVKEFMSRSFTGAEIIEEHQGFLQYHIESSSTHLSEMFGILEENAASLNIVDYSVSQTTLDQIFVKFAKEQHSEERVRRKTCCSCMCF